MKSWKVTLARIMIACLLLSDSTIVYAAESGNAVTVAEETMTTENEASAAQEQSVSAGEVVSAIPENHEPVSADNTVSGGELIVETGESGAEEEQIKGGICGENVTWQLSDTGLLTIAGEGAMYDYTSSDVNPAPWTAYRDSILNIEIGENISHIGAYAFCQTEISSLTLPEGVVSVGEGAFSSNRKLKIAFLPDSLNDIAVKMFEGANELQAVDFPERIETIGADAFRACYSLYSVVLPEGLLSIGDGAFALCGAVDLYGEYYNCSNFRSVKFPSTLEYIGASAFNHCEMLQTIELPNNVKTIGSNAFYYCGGLTQVVMPARIEEIGKDAFYGCDSLNSITFTWGVPTVGSTAFGGVSAECYFPSNNAAWTEDVQQNYGGSLTWIATEMDNPDGTDEIVGTELKVGETLSELKVGDTFTVRVNETGKYRFRKNVSSPYRNMGFYVYDSSGARVGECRENICTVSLEETEIYTIQIFDTYADENTSISVSLEAASPVVNVEMNYINGRSIYYYGLDTFDVHSYTEVTLTFESGEIVTGSVAGCVSNYGGNLDIVNEEGNHVAGDENGDYPVGDYRVRIDIDGIRAEVPFSVIMPEDAVWPQLYPGETLEGVTDATWIQLQVDEPGQYLITVTDNKPSENAEGYFWYDLRRKIELGSSQEQGISGSRIVRLDPTDDNYMLANSRFENYGGSSNISLERVKEVTGIELVDSTEQLVTYYPWANNYDVNSAPISVRLCYDDGTSEVIEHNTQEWYEKVASYLEAVNGDKYDESGNIKPGQYYLVCQSISVPDVQIRIPVEVKEAQDMPECPEETSVSLSAGVATYYKVEAAEIMNLRLESEDYFTIFIQDENYQMIEALSTPQMEKMLGQGTYYLMIENQQQRSIDVTIKISSEESSAEQLELGQIREVNISTPGERRTYIFTPEQDGYYQLMAESVNNVHYDNYVDLSDGNGNWLAADDDDGSQQNFKLIYKMRAGEKYIYSVRMWDSGIVGNFNITLSEIVVQQLDYQCESISLNAEETKLYEVTIAESDEYVIVSPEYMSLKIWDDAFANTKYSGSGTFQIVSLEAGSYILEMTNTYLEHMIENIRMITLEEKVLLINETETIVTEQSTGFVWYAFVPEETGYYEFISQGNVQGNEVTWYNENKTMLQSHAGGNTVKMQCEMEAGKTYYYLVEYSAQTAGNLEITCRKAMKVKGLSLQEDYEPLEFYYGLSAPSLQNIPIIVTYEDGSEKTILPYSNEGWGMGISYNGPMTVEGTYPTYDSYGRLPVGEYKYVITCQGETLDVPIKVLSPNEIKNVLTVGGMIEGLSDETWFKVNLEAGKVYEFTNTVLNAKDESVGSLSFESFDQNGNVVNRFSGDFIWIPDSSGIYYIRLYYIQAYEEYVNAHLTLHEMVVEDNITTNEVRNVNVETDGTRHLYSKIYSFTPDVSGTYQLTESAADGNYYQNMVILYDEQWEVQMCELNNTDYNNFCLTYAMEAGKTYYYRICFLIDSGVGEMNISLSQTATVTGIEVVGNIEQLVTYYPWANNYDANSTPFSVRLCYDDGTSEVLLPYTSDRYDNVRSYLEAVSGNKYDELGNIRPGQYYLVCQSIAMPDVKTKIPVEVKEAQEMPGYPEDENSITIQLDPEEVAYYRMETTEQKKLQVKSEDLFVISTRDQNFNLLENKWSGDQFARPLSAGTYYIQIENPLQKMIEVRMKVASAEPLAPDVTTEVEISVPGEIKEYSFIPEQDGYYQLMAESINNVHYDNYVELRDGNGNWLAADDDDGPQQNFKLIYKMRAGEKYTYSVRMLNSGIAGNFNITLSEIVVPQLDYQSESISLNAEETKLYEVTIAESDDYVIVSPEYMSLKVWDDAFTNTRYSGSGTFQIVSLEAGSYVLEMTNTYPAHVIENIRMITLENKVLPFNETETIVTEQPKGFVWYAFVPEETGYYEFISQGNVQGNNVTWYNENKTMLQSHAGGNTVKMQCKMEAGKIYYYLVEYSAQTSGNLEILCRKAMKVTGLSLQENYEPLEFYYRLSYPSLQDVPVIVTYEDGSVKTILAYSNEWWDMGISYNGPVTAEGTYPTYDSNGRLPVGEYKYIVTYQEETLDVPIKVLSPSEIKNVLTDGNCIEGLQGQVRNIIRLDIAQAGRYELQVLGVNRRSYEMYDENGNHVYMNSNILEVSTAGSYYWIVTSQEPGEYSVAMNKLHELTEIVPVAGTYNDEIYFTGGALAQQETSYLTARMMLELRFADSEPIQVSCSNMDASYITYINYGLYYRIVDAETGMERFPYGALPIGKYQLIIGSRFYEVTCSIPFEVVSITEAEEIVPSQQVRYPGYIKTYRLRIAETGIYQVKSDITGDIMQIFRLNGDTSTQIRNVSNEQKLLLEAGEYAIRVVGDYGVAAHDFSVEPLPKLTEMVCVSEEMPTFGYGSWGYYVRTDVSGNKWTSGNKTRPMVSNNQIDSGIPTVVSGNNMYSSHFLFDLDFELSYEDGSKEITFYDSALWNAYNVIQRVTDLNGEAVYTDANGYAPIGEYYVYFSTMGQEVRVPFNVTETETVRDIRKATGTIADQEYTGSEVTPDIELMYGELPLKLGVDYECWFEDNVDVGTAKAYIKGIGDYSGTLSIEFAIRQSELRITEQPASLELELGKTAIFNILAAGEGLRYQWQTSKNNGKTWSNSSLSGSKTSAVKVGVTEGRDGYLFRCIVTNAEGNSVISDTAKLTVKRQLSIDAQPVSVSAEVNEKVGFSVKVSGTNVAYQWQVSKNDGETWSDSGLPGNKTDTLDVTASAGRNGYQFRCVVKDAFGNEIVSDVAVLSVKRQLEISEQPTDIEAEIGSEVGFTVKVNGQDVTYQWQVSKNDGRTWSNSGLDGNRTNTVKVTASAGRDGYQFRCLIKDAAGNELLSDKAVLTIRQQLTITTQPADVTAESDQKIQFTVEAGGRDLTYQWQVSKNDGRTWADSGLSGNKTDTVSVTATTGRDGYQFRCVVRDAAGNEVISDAAVLFINQQFAIKTQPTNRETPEGKTVTFKIEATGQGLTYQWQASTNNGRTWKNSGLTGNKTEALRVKATAGRDGYQFRCVVTDADGNKLISDVGVLTVTNLLQLNLDVQ